MALSLELLVFAPPGENAGIVFPEGQARAFSVEFILVGIGNSDMRNPIALHGTLHIDVLWGHNTTDPLCCEGVRRQEHCASCRNPPRTLWRAQKIPPTGANCPLLPARIP